MNEIMHMPSDLSEAQRHAMPTGPGNALAHILMGLPELAKGVLKAIAAVSPVPKEARNNYHKYSYAAADAIIEEGRKALLAGGCVLLPVSASLNGSERQGPDRYELVRVFVLIHESGQCAPLQVTWPVVVENGRPLDKATGAADTLSLAYLFRDLLAMNRVDPADDVAGRDDRKAKSPNKPTMPADGIELERRMLKWEQNAVEARRCKQGELIAHVVRAYHAAWPEREPPPFPQWDSHAIKLACDTARVFLKEHPVPPANQGPANGRAAAPAPPAPPPSSPAAATPAKLSEMQVRELWAMLDRKGWRWADVVYQSGWAKGRQPLDLTSKEYSSLMSALEREKDVQPK